ncbi:Maf family protein [Pseudodesulfovibrio piezophilus]|uniref:dTTP/UTP pyrophosphatase n=1 Tax=Pseudodesulfovibrio piezophilus (strain DSM 21447 / JCM 15486 / C1TLV30) TaxID=1322246 RepID=M1WNB5_PSEP2|nr:Maf family protein [Pseudodesulfovibrio piezophilus]CCH47464.1 Maf-like protein Dde_0640 [Pseudodesulfovibrio piezophilus C1TLV30]
MITTPYGPFENDGPLILASGSPRRKELLSNLGLNFKIIPSTLDEPAPDAGEAPSQYAQRMATMKTLDIARQQQKHSPVIGADTIVVLNQRIMGKPVDKEDALHMLMALSGKTHQVITAFCLALAPNDVTTHSISTDVTMRFSRKSELEKYITTGEPLDKAGAYAIQGIGAFLITSIAGSYTNVVGLPVSSILDTLLTKKIIRVRSSK